jgi:hypothetical protein
MKIFRTLLSTLALVVIFGFISTEALAKKPVSSNPPTDETQTVLSNKEALNLAKSYHPSFVEVDPDITINDLKSYILNLNTRDLAAIDIAMQSYLASLEPPPVNQAPSIEGTPASAVMESEHYSFTPVASDPEGSSLQFSIVNQPAWAAFDTTTGNLSGTPGTGSAGSYQNILISVSDGELSDTLPAFDILVSAPVVYGAPTLLSAEISGSDVLLAWRQDNATPDGGYDVFIDGTDTGTSYRTTGTSLAISDLDLSLAHCFSVEARYISVSEFYPSNSLCTTAQEQPNQPPEISGTPTVTVNAGDSYLFTPSSSDADGDTLSFTVLNLPAWANFDTQTGSLYGTPEAQDAGSYSNIEIQVSDGQASTSLTPFTLLVEAVQDTTSTTLHWAAPTTRSDGSSLSLSEIDGYRIYMGESESSLSPVMDINDHTITQQTLTDLTAGTYYFGVTAYDTDGNESSFSNIIMRSTL